MFFPKSINNDLPPSILVPQTGAVLVSYEENGEFPFYLETNQVCDCVTLILSSKMRYCVLSSYFYEKR